VTRDGRDGLAAVVVTNQGYDPDADEREDDHRCDQDDALHRRRIFTKSSQVRFPAGFGT
jgi:hypothetical protein